MLREGQEDRPVMSSACHTVTHVTGGAVPGGSPVLSGSKRNADEERYSLVPDVGVFFNDSSAPGTCLELTRLTPAHSPRQHRFPSLFLQTQGDNRALRRP